MDDIVGIVVILIGLRALRAVADRFMLSDGPPGWPLGEVSRESFWRRTLPWPQGVQEDSEIAWHVPRPVEPAETQRRARAEERPRPPTRPQSRVVGR
jgi:hypothetical protein